VATFLVRQLKRGHPVPPIQTGWISKPSGKKMRRAFARNLRQITAVKKAFLPKRLPTMTR
jgi:hypothetical protein